MSELQMISAIASSSNSPSMVSSKTYDVFLSFRGEDTRRNFTSHLYEALKRKKVKTFIDNDELKKGDEISPALIKAIEYSNVSVVIFSENYASSKWCLNELCKIMDCKKEQGQVVIPVFYNIDPSHVRNYTGSYEQASAIHEEEPRYNTWKAALTEAANLAGWDSQTYRTESELIDDIVSDVLRKLTPRFPNQLKGLVGIEENIEQIESLLKIESSEVRILGIWGMGGIGKTTLATALFLKFSHGFEGRCFLTNVREKSENFQINTLCNKLFSDLLEEENHCIDAPFLVPDFFMRRLGRKKVFIVLDDVSTWAQLENLMIDRNYLGPGSRVIITTRDKHIFSQVDGIYEVKMMSFPDSLQLFCLNAFGEEHPKKGYELLSKRAAFYCKGVPLALKFLGKTLRSRNKQAWESELTKLQKSPNVEIHKVLKLSYDDLDRSQKDIFLDIACFFKGKYRHQVESALEAFDFPAASGIDDLLDKTLITISDDRIEIHDLIQEMGLEIVHQECIKEPGRRSRLWKPEEVLDVLKYNKGTEAIEGMTFDSSQVQDLHLSSDSFKGMTNLRYLKVHNKFKYGKCDVYFPNGLELLSDKLRYLLWDGCHLESLPSTFCAEKLVELYMPCSKLQKLWDGVQNLMNLKYIDLCFCKYLIEVPDLSWATNLESIQLRGCESLCWLHPSVFSLPKLMHLCLDGCRQIESLKTDVHLKSLCQLQLYNCSSLKEFSVTSEEMIVLDLAGTAIHELPSSIWHNRKLTFLALSGCNNLNIVGNKLSDEPVMRSLTDLDLSSCTQLNASNLWFLLDGIRSLTRLDLTYCCNLQALPDNIGNLSSLKYLNLSKTNVKRLPADIKTILMLEDLILDYCMKLVAIPELPSSLRVLSAINCISLEEIFNLNNVEIDSGLLSLRILCLRNCCSLQILPNSIELLSSLEELDLSGNNVEILSTNIEHHWRLRKIVLDNCRGLVFLPDLMLLPSWSVLRALNCTSLDTNFTQQLVLERMLQRTITSSSEHGFEHLVHDQYAIFPGAQVSNKFSFRTEGTSISIPYLPKSDMCGFIYCIILSEGSFVTDKTDVAVSFIYEHGKVVWKDGKYIGNGILISDHVLFLYHEISNLYTKVRSSYDDCINISFKIRYKDELKEWLTADGIKGCGVFPVYASESRVKLVESESLIAIRVGGSNRENVHDYQLLPAKKRRT